MEISEKDKQKPVFWEGNIGLILRMQLDVFWTLTNAPATFQRLMEQFMGEIHHKECLIFLDDIF